MEVPVPRSFLPADALCRYRRFDGEPDARELAGCFHLADADLELVAAQATPANRLGLAPQLGCARFLGNFAPDLADVPPGVVTYGCGQIGVHDTSALAEYGRCGTTNRHRQLIRRHDGYRELREPRVAVGMALSDARRAHQARRPLPLRAAGARRRWATPSHLPAAGRSGTADGAVTSVQSLPAGQHHIRHMMHHSP
jgi:hypothetical protein